MYKIITNVSNIPDYRIWSTKNDDAQLLDSVPENLKQAKIKNRSAAADFLVSTKNTRPIDAIANPLDIERWRITDTSVVNDIAHTLGFSKPSGRVQVLGPGAMVPLHFDDLRFGYIDGSEPSYQINEFTTTELQRFDRDPQSAQRVLIMLEDSLPGQMLLFGDIVCYQWRRGDVIHWDWVSTIHATINAGYWRRPLLRLTGLVDDDWTSKYY
jgi:hypothetical protein